MEDNRQRPAPNIIISITFIKIKVLNYILFLMHVLPCYVSPNRICRLVSMLSVRSRPRRCGVCGGFLWESQYDLNRPLFWQCRLPSYIFLLLRYFTALPRDRVILSGAAAGCVVEESVPMEKTDPSIRLRLTQDDSGSRQPPTIILQITLLVSVKGRRLYRRIYFQEQFCYNAKR